MSRWQYIVCLGCSSAISVNERHCPYCGMFMDARQLQSIVKDVIKNSQERISPLLVARSAHDRKISTILLLSLLLPGSGQFYMGHAFRGLVVFISVLITVSFSINLLLLLWMLNLIDAWMLAKWTVDHENKAQENVMI